MAAVGLRGGYKGRRRMVILHSGIGQDVAAGWTRPKVGVAEDKFILTFVQFIDSFGWGSSYVYDVTPCL